MKKPVPVLIFALLLLSLCSLNAQDKYQSIIPDTPPDIKSEIMTPEVLWSFGRITEHSVSPEGNLVAYAVRYFNIGLNKGQTDFYIMKTDGSDKKRLTESSDAKFGLKWRPDGKKIAFVSNRGGSMQIWEMNPDGSDPKQVSNIDGGVGDFKYSPDMQKVLYLAEVKIDKTALDIYPDLPKANVRIYNDIMYRHWDEWEDGSYSHIFISDYNGSDVKNGYDINEGEGWDTPMKPFGGMEQINWSPDSKSVAYVTKKMRGKQYAVSTNSDLYIYDLNSKQTVNLTDGMMGFESTPSYSPDGMYIAWTSMERDGYESDKTRLFIYNFQTKEKTYCTKDLDQNAEGPEWADDSKSVYFVSGVRATEEIYRYDVNGGKITRVTDGIHNYLSAAPAGKVLIATRQSMSKPTEIYSVNPSNGEAVEISFVNKPILDKLKFGEVKKRMVKTTDDKDMLSWVIYPPNFDPAKKYPTLLFCEGGPQSTVNQFWSYRWNFQMMAANGYIIIAPNRRGLPSFGMEWLEQISGDYGGQNMKDYISAIDDIVKEPYVNKDKLGAVGASYGGFSVFWLAGNHEKRFKAFIAHDGMFNFESQYLETEEMWFVNWDLGGAFWEKENQTAQKSYNTSPHKFVQNWDTPILIVHGEKDYRIAYTQAMQAFNAAILLGVPAELLLLPEENHWVLSPQNGILWQRRF
ncbi:MAG: S9 family peptidase, partial [Ignavibacteria bacterium]|nr:S9 family peptidase [Ignavibacteria bacterium]